jgi:2'-5' RNA ligase
MTKRIFIALPLSETLQEKIIKWRKKIEKLPVRFLEPKNLHITLLPPWYEKNINEIEEKLQNLKSNIGNIKIKFKKISFGPNILNPRLIWIEGETPKEILILKEKIEKTLNIITEKRPFKTHITIARFNPLNFKHFAIKKLNEEINWEEEIKSFVIMESKLSSHGADYEVIKEIPL